MRDDDGALLIAKLPHAADAWDVMAWEKTMLDLAVRSGLRVPVNRLVKVGPRIVLLMERFDRRPGGIRVGYISAMTIAVHNTDDHLRNHGFLRDRGGWTLSPLFDVNPNPDLGARRMTGIVGAVDAKDEAGALLDLAAPCHLSQSEAMSIVRRVVEGADGWRHAAGLNGIGQREVNRFAEAIDSQLASLRAVSGG